MWPVWKLTPLLLHANERRAQLQAVFSDDGCWAAEIPPTFLLLKFVPRQNTRGSFTPFACMSPKILWQRILCGSEAQKKRNVLGMVDSLYADCFWCITYSLTLPLSPYHNECNADIVLIICRMVVPYSKQCTENKGCHSTPPGSYDFKALRTVAADLRAGLEKEKDGFHVVSVDEIH